LSTLRCAASLVRVFRTHADRSPSYALLAGRSPARLTAAVSAAGRSRISLMAPKPLSRADVQEVVQEVITGALAKFHRDVVSLDIRLIVDEAKRELRDEMNGGFDAVHSRLDKLDQEYHMVVAGLRRLESGINTSTPESRE
jgi:hypothetical protein